MLKTFLILMISLLSFIIEAQNITLIGSNYIDDSYFYKPKEENDHQVFIYELKGASLDIKASFAKEPIIFVRSYDDFSYWITRDYKNTYYKLTWIRNGIIDSIKVKNSNSINVPWVNDGCILNNSKLLLRLSSKANDTLIILDVAKKKTTTQSYKVLKECKCSGENNIGIRYDNLVLKSDSLQIPRIWFYQNNKSNGVALSQKSILPKEKGIRLLCARNKQINILYFSNSIGRWFEFRDSSFNLRKEMKMADNNATLRIYKNWIFGRYYKICEDNCSKKSPGYNKRASNRFFDYENDQRATFLGKLFLMDQEQLRYVEFNTGQGDSEILHVKNNLVYYRAFDEIYTRSILPGFKLGPAQLVVKDEDIPTIHWAISED